MSTPSLSSARVSTVLRLHSIERIDLLGLALMSLCGQRHAVIEPIVVLQRFSPEDAAKVEAMAAALPWGAEVEGPRILNITDIPEGDQRAELLNRGIQAATGDFIGFLDYDDYLYPNAYSKLLARFTPTTVAAMGGVVVSHVDPDSPGGHVIEKRSFPINKERMRFFYENLYPIHSMLIRAEQLKAVHILAHLDVLEDYYMLLNVLSRGDWDTALIDEPICEYVYWKDNSNTIDVDGTDKAKQLKWDRAREVIQRWRDTNHANIRVTDIARLVGNDLHTISGTSAGADTRFESAILRAIRNFVFVLAFRRKADATLTVVAPTEKATADLKLSFVAQKKQPIIGVIYGMRKRWLRPPKMRLLWIGPVQPCREQLNTYKCAVQIPILQLSGAKRTEVLVAFAIEARGKFMRLRFPPIESSKIVSETKSF